MVLTLAVHLAGEVLELTADRSGLALGPSVVLKAGLTFDEGRLRPARSDDDPGRVLADPLARLGGPVPVVIDRFPVTPEALAVAAIDRAVQEATTRWGQPSALLLAIPARWARRQRQALAEAAAEAGWPEARILPAAVVAARQLGSRGLVGVVEVGPATETSVVRLTGDRGDIVGVPLRDADLGAGRFDELVAEQFRRTLHLAGVDREELAAVVLTGPSRYEPGVADGLRQALGPVVVDGERREGAPVAKTERMEPTEPLVVGAPRRPVPAPAAWPKAAVAVIVVSLVVIAASAVTILLAR